MSETPSIFEKLGQWIRNSVSFKIFSVAFLILLMLIPTSMIKDLITERQQRQQEAINEINLKWGEAQTITGPVLSIPYISYYTEDDDVKKVRKVAHFLPEKLKIQSEVNPEIRYRGIYEAVLYQSDISLNGNFPIPDFKRWKIESKNILYDEAYISIGITDLRGINESVDVVFASTSVQLGPGIPDKDVVSSGISGQLDLNTTKINGALPFSTSISVNGSSGLWFVPLGAETQVDQKSSWPTPSFTGNFLPDNRNIAKDGFQANWKILQLNRNYPQQWLGAAHQVNSSTFGTELMVGVDQYQKNYRSAKYAVMIISLCFVLFFFIEVINRKRIHPIQYLLVGLALTLFYALLLSISEQSSFSTAYLISSVAVISLITIYVQAIVRSRKLTLLLLGALVLLFGFIFIILQLQDYALLAGSIGLFVVLAMIMYTTRKIDWYALSEDN